MQHWLTDDEVNSVMRQYDADGELAVRRVLTATTTEDVSGHHRKCTCGTAGDGSITMEEFEHLAKDGVLLHGTLQQYSEAFEAVDSDHDGEHPDIA